MSSEDKIREAEQAVIAETRRVLEKGVNHIGLTKGDIRPMREAIRKLDALESPLPSREELCTAHPRVSAIHMEHAGAYWLNWAATQAACLDADGLDQHPKDLHRWADELEARLRWPTDR